MLGYFTEREEFEMLIAIYIFVFMTFVYAMNLKINANHLFKIGLLFRIIFLFSIPFLSQDFYRFIWDGRLIISGINPYEFLPNQIIDTLVSFSQADILYQKMGDLSAAHYSNYPPFNQYIFAITGLLSGKSILGSAIVFRIIIILTDVSIYFYGRKILIHFNQSPDKIFWYFLNPLVIIELTGNLHFEGVMLLFLILGFYFLIQNNWFLAAVFISISISVKLLPLLLLPIFWRYLGWKKSIAFYFWIIILNLLYFIPFLTHSLVSNYLETITLWFTNFEFNASIYYLVREIGFYFKGYNIIGTVGKITPIITILIVLFYAFFKKNESVQKVITHSLIALTIYFFISTTVHPWYVINLVLLSVFTKYKFPIVWSATIILSYYAYGITPFKENMILIFIEYLVVIIVFLFEINNKQFPYTSLIKSSNSR